MLRLALTPTASSQFSIELYTPSTTLNRLCRTPAFTSNCASLARHHGFRSRVAPKSRGASQARAFPNHRAIRSFHHRSSGRSQQERNEEDRTCWQADRTKSVVFASVDCSGISALSLSLEPPRIRIGRDSDLHRPMRAYAQVLTTPTADTPGTTLVLHFDTKRYMIGSMGEGTQRGAVEMGFKFSKLSECFMTGRTEWANIGGLIGMILSLADSSASRQAALLEDARRKALSKSKRSGVAEYAQDSEQPTGSIPQPEPDSLTIFGPSNLNHAIATARRFVFRRSMPTDIHEITEGKRVPDNKDETAPYWMDENILVWAVTVEPNRRPVSPRKRSIDEVDREEPNSTPQTQPDASEAQEESSLAAKAVVTEMLNSSWKLDRLYETRLGDVKLPATVFVRDEKTKEMTRYNGPWPDNSTREKVDLDQRIFVRKPWPGALIRTLPHTSPARGAVSYVIRTHTQRGKFDPARAQALKVEKGKNWSALCRNEPVQNKDGELISPDMVLGPSKIGGGLAVIAVPDQSYLEPTLRRAEWRNESIMRGVGAIFWILGSGVVNDSRLRDFMAEFQHLEHVVSSPEVCPNNLAMDTAAASTARLQKVDPKRYAVPVHSNTASLSAKDMGEKIRNAVRGQVIQLQPTMEVNEKHAIPFLDTAEAAAGVNTAILEEAEKAQNLITSSDVETQRWSQTLPPGSAEAQIITLGTGSSSPSKYRNVSATLLRVPGWGSVLFDCGENTLGQLRRVFSEAETKQLLRDLRIITISHMHADHHLGTAGLLRAWYQEAHGSMPLPKGQNARSTFVAGSGLAVVAEVAMQQWLHEYSSVEDFGYSRLAPVSMVPSRPNDMASKMTWFVPSDDLQKMSYHQRQSSYENHILSPSDLGLADFQAAVVRHCHGARGIAITFPSGFKVSYSGDCRPSKLFAAIGRGSTVCIHEATFDDALYGDAVAKRHSTTSEALSVAQAMGAKACVLTHFSQRYSKIPILEKGDGSDALALTLPDVGSMDEEEDDGPIENDVAPKIDRTSNDTDANNETSTTGAVKFKLDSDMRVCVAFDYMRVKVGEIPELDKFTPALLKLFAEEEKSMEVTGDQEAINDQGKKDKHKDKQKTKKKAKPSA